MFWVDHAHCKAYCVLYIYIYIFTLSFDPLKLYTFQFSGCPNYIHLQALLAVKAIIWTPCKILKGVGTYIQGCLQQVASKTWLSNFNQSDFPDDRYEMTVHPPHAAFISKSCLNHTHWERLLDLITPLVRGPSTTPCTFQKGRVAPQWCAKDCVLQCRARNN